jgi:RHS repeat-associated protein
MTAEENVGTNGGTAWTRPTSPDASDDTHLVTMTTYNAQGLADTVTDPRGIIAKTVYDLLGRTTETIAAFTDGIPTNDTNQTTAYTYDGNNDVLTMTAVLPTGQPSQTTAYVYGVSPTTGSTLFSNDLIAATEYPDSTTGAASSSPSDDVSQSYNNLGQPISKTDQNGTTHTYSYDVLGRETLDSVAVTTGNPQNVDTSILALGYSYNTQGLAFQQTSYSDAAATTIVNQDQDVYNGFAQLTGEYQSVSGAVDTSTTPEVQYVYSSVATGSLPTEMNYPNGRILHYGYDNTTLDAALGRVDYLADDNGSGGIGAHLADYGYLGAGMILNQADGDGVTLTTTLDQFGRVQEMNWLNTSTSTSTDDFQYGYDRDGNVLNKLNSVNANFSELYSYDSLNRLTNFQRGTLSSDNTSIVTANTLPGSSQSWNLDAVGNQTATTTDGTPTSKTQNSKNELNGIGSSSLVYDNNGNTTTDENGDTLTYDAWNRTKTISAGTTSYAYDANGRRITQIASGTTTTFYLSSQDQVIEERQGSVVTAQNVFSIDYVNDLLLRDDNSISGSLGITGSGLGERLYSQHNANFNTTALTDATGSVVERFVYTPYGQQTVLSASWTVASDAYHWPYYFQGMRLAPDGQGNLYLSQSRIYDSDTGIWGTRDPGGYVDGTNDYQFVHSDPSLLVDASGFDAESPGSAMIVSQKKLMTTDKAPRLLTHIVFSANDPKNCPEIGVIQIVRVTTPDGKHDVQLALKGRLTKNGWGVDRGPGKQEGWYGVPPFDFGIPDEDNPTEHRPQFRQGKGTAEIWDMPGDNGPIKFELDTYFICKTTNTVLGHLEWGFSVDRNDEITAGPGKYSDGSTQDFNDAVDAWNKEVANQQTVNPNTGNPIPHQVLQKPLPKFK